MKREKKRYDYHHIRPRSRQGSNKSYNLIRKERHQHENYHRVFRNKTPEEVLKYLFDEWGFEQYFKRKGGIQCLKRLIEWLKLQ